MMSLVIDRLVEVISTFPGLGLSSDRLGIKRPSGGGDVPAIAISLSLEAGKSVGIGRYIRSGDTITRSSNVVEVNRTSQIFSSALDRLRLWPLPLKKNPSSTGKEFTESDIQIRNVTDLANPIEYRMVKKPAEQEEFKLELRTAEVIFGQSQREGDKLEVTHWTIAWRNEIFGESYIGLMLLEVWASSFDEADDLSRKLQAGLSSNRAVLREKGFLKLQAASLDTIENLSHASPSGSLFSVWNQKLGYRFAFESEDGGELSGGIPIKRIDVDLENHIAESFSIP
jgi:hypothetical protein